MRRILVAFVGVFALIGVMVAPAAAEPASTQSIFTAPRAVVYGYLLHVNVIVDWSSCSDWVIRNSGPAANVADGSCAIVHVNAAGFSFYATYVGAWQVADNGYYLQMQGLGWVNGGKTHWSLTIRKSGWYQTTAEFDLGQSYNSFHTVVDGPLYGFVFLN